MEETMKLFNYYSLDECIDRKQVIKKMKALESDGKIEYSIDGEILNINDIDLEEMDIEELNEMFDENDVFPYLEKEEDDSDEFGDDYYDDDDY